MPTEHPTFTVAQTADLLGVSDDTVRRWIEAGRLPPDGRGSRGTRVAGREVARVARELAEQGTEGVPRAAAVSARNRLRGIVTAVTTDRVMAQVELQCGPYRMVSLMSAEAAEELGLAEGVAAIASVKSTNVVVELP